MDKWHARNTCHVVSSLVKFGINFVISNYTEKLFGRFKSDRE